MKNEPGAVRKAAPKKAAKKAAKKPAKKAGTRKAVARVASPEEVAAQVAVDLAEEDQRAHRAHAARVSGKDWDAATAKGGFASTGATKLAVSRMLRRAVEERSAEHRQESLQLSIDRHEALIAAHWYFATVKKDSNSAMIVLRAQAQIDKLERNGEGESVTATRTIIITGSEDEFVAGMQAVVEGRAKGKVIDGFALEGMPDTLVPPPA